LKDTYSNLWIFKGCLEISVENWKQDQWHLPKFFRNTSVGQSL